MRTERFKNHMRGFRRKALVLLFLLPLTFLSRTLPAAPAFYIQISESQKLSLSILAKATKAQSWGVDTQGNTDGDATKLYGTVQPGIYTIECLNGCGDFNNIDLYIENASSNCAGVTFGTWLGDYDGNGEAKFPIKGLKMPGQGETKYLYVGATISTSTSTVVGNCTPSFNIAIYANP